MTPLYVSVTPDWVCVLRVWEELPAPVRRVAGLLGVREQFLVQAVKGTVNTRVRSSIALSTRG